MSLYFSDVAAHSCLVTSDFIVKVGDYGTAVHLHKVWLIYIILINDKAVSFSFIKFKKC